MFIFEPNAKIDVLETKYSKTHILRHSGFNNNLLCIIHTTIWKWVPQFCTRQMSTTKINWCLKEAVFNYTQTALLHYCKLKLHNTSLSVVEDSSTENKEHLNNRYMETPPIWFMCLLFFFLPLIQWFTVQWSDGGNTFFTGCIEYLHLTDCEVLLWRRGLQSTDRGMTKSNEMHSHFHAELRSHCSKHIK